MEPQNEAMRSYPITEYLALLADNYSFYRAELVWSLDHSCMKSAVEGELSFRLLNRADIDYPHSVVNLVTIGPDQNGALCIYAD